jgi:hypothetical protein
MITTSGEIPMNPSHPHQNLKSLIRDGVRATIQSTLSSAIQEVTEEELRVALREPAFKGPLMDVIRLELQQAIEELRRNGKPKAMRKR